MNIADLLREDAALVNAVLPAYFENSTSETERLYEAMRYSVLSDGKRIRPFLTIEFCRLFDGNVKAALPFAAAIECVHASSLIHDDMPCMDNDDLRRGRPTNHVVFGEDVALLAGDALITRGYEIAARNAEVSAEVALSATAMLLEAAGAVGMMGGQQIDLAAENAQISFDTLLLMHKKKTGALIRAAALLGCHGAGICHADDARLKDAATYAEGIGLAFQIIDDVLDAVGDEAVLGKKVHADNAVGKTTFLTFMDVDKALAYASEVTENAIGAIQKYEKSEALIEFARFLLSRKK